MSIKKTHGDPSERRRKKMESRLSGNEDTNIAIKNPKSLMSLLLMPRDEAKLHQNCNQQLADSQTFSKKLSYKISEVKLDKIQPHNINL